MASTRSSCTQPTLRPETPEDATFLLRLYAESRATEVASFGWPEPQVQAFMRMQFDAQTAHYRHAYPDAEFLIVEYAGEAIGRLCEHRGNSLVNLVDISLLSRWRGAGIGSALLTGLLARANAARLPVELHVARDNPAARLYQRFGFCVVGDDGLHLRMRLETGQDDGQEKSV